MNRYLVLTANNGVESVQADYFTPSEYGYQTLADGVLRFYTNTQERQNFPIAAFASGEWVSVNLAWESQ